jgi:hypothetical protein
LIPQRTKAALAAVKARGVTLGNPRLAEARAVANERQGKAADAFAANVRPILDSLGEISPNAKAKALNEHGIKTTRGGKWTPVQVLRVLGADLSPHSKPPDASGLVRGGRTPRALLSAVIANRGCETLYRSPMVRLNAIRDKRSKTLVTPGFHSKSNVSLGPSALNSPVRGQDP